uniref:Uncharacterized protein n=1 Tax=Arundo donax TaxID=35708 RepID=A0A0A9C813_ARUDO
MSSPTTLDPDYCCDEVGRTKHYFAHIQLLSFIHFQQCEACLINGLITHKPDSEAGQSRNCHDGVGERIPQEAAVLA